MRTALVGWWSRLTLAAQIGRATVAALYVLMGLATLVWALLPRA
jgi:hypothetical protein